MKNNSPTLFYYKEGIKQGYDKKNVPKIGVEHIKDNGEFYLYTFGHLTQRSFLIRFLLENFLIYMLFTHVCQCAPMCEI
jgi:hypothetical protein